MKTSVATLLPLLAPHAAVDAFFLAAPPPPGAFPRARMMTTRRGTTAASPPLGASSASILAAPPNDREDRDELSDAIAGVKAAAGEFGGGAERFASAWIDRALVMKDDDGAAELPSGLLEECVIDDGDERCQRFERALKRLDALLGVGAGEQY